MRWRHLPIVAFDTETTGLEPFAGDRIIEVAAVVLRLDDSGEVVDRHDVSHLVNPGIPIPRKVTEITGISDHDVAGAPEFRDVAQEVYDLFGGSIAVAHNFPFDLAFLSQEFRGAGLRWPDPIAEVDTVDVSIKRFPDANSHRLGDLCSRLDVPLETAHRATDDAAACGLAFAKMARRDAVEDDLQVMLDWAKAIGRPPTTGPIQPDDEGRLVFTEGKHVGRPVAEHPLYMAWMVKARTKGSGGWQWRYSESTRGWIRRWLDVRGSGRARTNPKTFSAQDWVLDSCIAPDRRAR